MPLRSKLKSFWISGPLWWRWVKRLFLIALAWPLLSTLVYAFIPVPITNLMIFRLITGHGLHKSWVQLDQISADLPRAVVASEDQRFCQHHGVDWADLPLCENLRRISGMNSRNRLDARSTPI